MSKLEGDGDYKVQDRVKMEITITAKNDVSMGGIRLPLPAGVTILSSRSDELNLSFEERTEEMWRGYFDYIPKGKYKIEVVFRLNQPGDFEVPGTRIEALYSPEVFGELQYWNMTVK